MTATGQTPRLHVAEWEEFSEIFRQTHKQGEHVAIVGQTGSGKSVLGLALCRIVGSRPGKDRRPAHVVVLATKPRDDTIRKILPEREWPIVKKWPPAYGQEHCIVWPRHAKPSQRVALQRRVFSPLLDVIYMEGGQTVCIDEASYFERGQPNGLGLAGTMEEYWTAARSNKITLIAGTQRPRHVTRSMWSEPSWIFIFPPDDEDDLRRVAELSGAKDAVIQVTNNLGPYEFLCVRRQRAHEKTLYVSKVQ